MVKNSLKSIALLWLTLLCLPLMAGTVTLSGTVKYPDGTPVNGRLILSLAKSATNICSTPFKVVPSNKSTVVRIVNGSVQNGSASFDTTDCLTPRIPYYVAMLDNSNNILFTDNWYFPTSTDSSVDVGTLMPVEMSSAISVSLPKAIIQNPTTSQTVTQPIGTVLNIVGALQNNGFVMPLVIGQYNATSQSANVPGQILLAAASITPGTYRASCYVVVTRSASVSSTLPQCTLQWRDKDTNLSVFTSFSATSTLNGVGNPGISGVYAFEATSADNILFTTSGYVSSGATSMQYAVHVKLEFLGP
jgi:hypothetical protein